MPVARYSQHQELLRQLIEVEQVTQGEAAWRLGVDRTTVQRWCKRFQLQTQRTGQRSGPRHTGWKGGRRKVGRYWYIYAPDHPRATRQGYVAEHRLVMEATLGRYLLPEEVVHHCNTDPEDNRPENLVMFPSNGKHLRHELTGKVPQWTPEGWQRMQAGVRKAASLKRSISGDRRRTQTSAHHSS